MFFVTALHCYRSFLIVVLAIPATFNRLGKCDALELRMPFAKIYETTDSPLFY